MDRSSGVSEVIGVILLISVVALAVAIIAAGLFSQPLPQKIPNVRFISQVIGPNVTIYHDGGESLYKGEFYIKIDTTEYKNVAPVGSNVWDVGKTLEFPTPSNPNPTVQIFYNTGSGDALLDQERIQPVQNLVPDVLPVYVDPCAGLCNLGNCTSDQIGDEYDNIVTRTATIFIRKNKQASSLNAGILLFRVTKSGSSIYYNGNPDPITPSVNDIIEIKRMKDKQDDFKIFGLGDTFYQMRGQDVSLKQTYAVNGTIKNFGTVTIDNAWITGYEDLGSSFTITSETNKAEYTFLAINNTTPYPYYNGFNKITIIISGIRPIGVGLFNLDYDFNSNSDTGMSFVGTYDNIEYK